MESCDLTAYITHRIGMCSVMKDGVTVYIQCIDLMVGVRDDCVAVAHANIDQPRRFPRTFRGADRAIAYVGHMLTELPLVCA